MCFLPARLRPRAVTAAGTVPGKGGRAAAQAPTLSAGRREAHGLAPLAPGALVALLLGQGVLQVGHLHAQPGLVGGPGVQLHGLQGEPGHPHNVVPVPGPLGGDMSSC